jgi:predicted Zn-dependent protease
MLLPPLAERLANGQPVITREQAHQLSKRILSLTSADEASVWISHTVKSVTQIASNRVRNTNDGDVLQIHLGTKYGDTKGIVSIDTNQLDDAALRDLVLRAEALGNAMFGVKDVYVNQWDEQDSYPPVRLRHSASIEALQNGREAIVPQVIAPVQQRSMKTSAFVGVMARAEAVLTDRGITAYSNETDCEVTATARPADGKTSGWSGQAARDWSKIDAAKVATEAVEISQQSMNPRALEPGRRTAILGPAAVAQLMRFFALHFNGGKSDDGYTAFSKKPDQRKGSRWNERLFDTRVKVTTDSGDTEGGFRPYFGIGFASHPTTWVENGMLRCLAYGTFSLRRGKPYAEMPYGFRLHGGDTTVAQMIAQCEDGIYVNRFSSVDTIDRYSGMLTGVTRDGCFLVREGKIERPVKNFRFLASPFFVLNNLIAMGPERRAPYGYVPWTEQERWMTDPEPSYFFDWPRRPMIVPPLMVRDFNFNALVDAV